MAWIHSEDGWRRAAAAVGLAAAGGLLLTFPQAAASGAARGLALCGQVLIPSLFPFLVIGGVLIRSGIAAAVGRRWEGIPRRLFGLPGCCAAGILMAFAGGYPTGAAAVAALRKQGDITPDEGKRMMRFCVAGGPGFVVNAVGAGITGYSQWGWILFGAQLLSALLIGIVTVPAAARRAVTSRRIAAPKTGIAAAFTGAVGAAGETMLAMCGFVVVFSAVLSLIDAMGVTARLPHGGLAALPACLLEVTAGCVAAAHSGAAAPFLLGFTVCFGGFSVHCQIAAILKDSGVFTTEFFLFRLVHGVLGGVLAAAMFPLARIPLSVWGDHGAPVGEWVYQNGGVSAALLLFCGLWMLTALPRTSDT